MIFDAYEREVIVLDTKVCFWCRNINKSDRWRKRIRMIVLVDALEREVIVLDTKGFF
jgi:hypothetical protein